MSDTQSILDKMTAGVMQKKAEKATKLTPVAGEVAQALPRTPAPFPNDQPQEVVEKIISDLTIQISRLTEVRDALTLLVGKEPEAVVVPAVAVSATISVDKVAEREADARVEAKVPDYAQLQKEAQEAAFGPANPPMEPTGWSCPTHPDGTTKQLVSKKGRKYRACTQCEEFER